MLNTITLSDLVANKEIIWQKEQASLKDQIRDSGIYNVEDWEAGTGDTREYSEIDLEEYATVKDESDDAQQARIQQGYSKTVSPVRFGKDVNISWELRRRGKYREITRRLTSLAKMTSNRLDLDGSHRITFGTATTYTDLDGRLINISTGDALALFQTAHLLRGTSSTYRNRLATNPRLSEGSLEQMEQMKVENTMNQFGQKMSLSFDVLWTTDDPNTMNTARKILQSTAEIAGPHEGVINVNRGKYRHVVLPRVATLANGNPDTTKRYYWGLASSMNSDGYMVIEEEPNMTNPSVGSNAEEFSTEDWFFKGRGSWAFCWVGGRSIGFSSGDGTA